MAYNIINIDEHTWIIDEGMVRFFLLEGSEKALMIDCGMSTTNAKDIALTLTDKPVELILTHADRDHIASHSQFEWFYMSGAEASNFYKSNGADGKFIPVENGEILSLGDRAVEIISMPGHTPGSIAILDIGNKMIFTGDPVQDGNVFMFGVQREMHAYMKSLIKLEKEKDRFDDIYPSHGTCPLGTDIIMNLYNDARKVVSGAVEPVEVDMHGNKVKLYKGNFAGFLSDIDYIK